VALKPQIMWTVLPAGTNVNGPKLSIFVSPKLDDGSGKKTGDYDCLLDWPAYLNTLVFGLKVGTGPNAPTFPITVTPPASTLWTTLFPQETRVKTYEFADHAQRAVRSFSARAIHSYVEGLYDAVAAASPRDYPDLNQENETSTLVNFIGGSWIARVRRAQPARDAVGYSPPLPPGFGTAAQPGTHPDRSLEAALQAAVPTGSGIPAAELYRAYRFYNRGQQEQFVTQQGELDKSKLPDPPEPPRFDFHEALALLADHPVLLRALGIVLDVSLSQSLAVLARYGSPVQLVVGTPTGAPTLSQNLTPATAFDPATFWPAARPGSDLVRGYLEVGNKNYFEVIQADVDAQAIKTVDHGVNMKGLLVSALDSFIAANCSGSTDVKTDGVKVPQSLPAQRNAGLTLLRSERDDAVYAQFQRAALNDADPNAAVLYYEDVLRGYRVDVQHNNGRWLPLCARSYSYGLDGWTPRAPLTGQDEGFVKAVSATSTAKDPPSGAKDLYLHESLFGWHNWSLVVPLPGRSASVVHNKDKTQSELTQREDGQINPDFPIEIRTSVPRGTLPRLRFGQSYSLRARLADLAGNGPLLGDTLPAGALATAPVTYRRYEPVAAPALVLRAPVTSGESSERLVIRSKVTSDSIPGEDDLFNATCERHVAPPKATLQMAELHGMLDGVFTKPDDAFEIAKREAGTFANEDGYHPDKQLELPYLPDPLALGAFFETDAGVVEPQAYEPGAGYPYWQPFRLVLSGTDKNAPRLTAGTAGAPYSVELPPGTMLTVRYSSVLDPAKHDLLMRVANMSAATLADFKANNYQHWMLTPQRELTFVHAVEQPLADPFVKTLALGRSQGATFATMRVKMNSHSTSTGVLELFARWVEKVDRLQDPGPKDEERMGRAFEHQVPYGQDDLSLPDNCSEAKHEFGDTKHRLLHYYLVGTTRYREYFLPIAQTPQLFRRQGPELEAKHLLSSARPEAPRVLYVIPTFAWETSNDGNTSTRVGRGLRVYVDRPWFSSGDGELLGVLVPDAGDVPEAVRKYVSEWGADPVWDSKGPSGPLQPEHFTPESEDDADALTVQSGLTLAEFNDAPGAPTVTAVGIPWHYSAERQLYYFDVVLDAGAMYTPFVRLALARFQPYSLSGCHLSRVSRVDFAQLMADRTASISYRGTSNVDVTVSGYVARNRLAKTVLTMPTSLPSVHDPRSAVLATGTGSRAPSTSAQQLGSGRVVRAFVERRTAGKQQELGWQPVGGAEVLAPLASKSGELTFAGSVPLPNMEDGAEYRLTVQELELFQTDPELGEGALPVQNPESLPLRSRLVYLDYLALAPE